MILFICFALIALVSLILLSVTIANSIMWERLKPQSKDNGGLTFEKVSVLIPARNEELTIERCIGSVLQQGDLVDEILIYDDQSEDHTAELVNTLARTDSRIQLIKGNNLPDGWCGKPHACYKLALSAHSPWILYIDSDAIIQPGGISAIVQRAEKRRLTMLASWPGFLLVNTTEKFLMPMLNFFVFTIYPTFAAERSQDKKFGLAHGACMLFRRETYLKTGGHSLVKNELFEDTALSRQWRSMGQRSQCYDGQEVVKVRMYSSLKEIWSGFKKNFYPGFRSGAMFWFFMFFHFVVFLLPIVLLPLFVGSDPGIILFVTVISIFLIRLTLSLRFSQPVVYIILHPFAEMFVIALGISSWWNWNYGSGVLWKGRLYRNDTILAKSSTETIPR